MSEETGVSGMAGRRKGMGIEQAVKGVGKEQAAKKQAVKAEGEEQAAKKQVVKGKGMEEAGNRAGRERKRSESWRLKIFRLLLLLTVREMIFIKSRQI